MTGGTLLAIDLLAANRVRYQAGVDLAGIDHADPLPGGNLLRQPLHIGDHGRHLPRVGIERLPVHRPQEATVDALLEIDFFSRPRTELRESVEGVDVWCPVFELALGQVATVAIEPGTNIFG